ncbi:MAG: glucose-6-phosphate isomerase [Bacteroidota bacterium]|nr:glucose-6-phosphate isomerase [Bacteroidota bacterium]
MEKLLENRIWNELTSHYQDVKSIHVKEHFEKDSERFSKFSLRMENLLLDYSKNKITDKTIELLIKLAKSRGVEKAINDLFEGIKINTTEKRPALHTALRSFSKNKLKVSGQDIMEEIRKEREKIKNISEKIRDGQWKGYSGKPIKYLINIGIGGSYLGPRMVTEALKEYADNSLKIKFISNIDSVDLKETLKKIDLETTLFIVSSKSFNTQETLTNASVVKNMLLNRFQDENAIASHFIGVTANPEKAVEFGIPEENILKIWDWVGGRYSVWSSVGFIIAVQIGYNHFEELLQGANEMDEHFKNAPLNKNIPVMLAVLGIWYNNFFKSETYALLPYSQQLRLLPAYFQQVDMESNGKSVTKQNEEVNYSTGAIIWGQQGTNGQHAFFQLLHQGTKFVPFDLIGFVNSFEDNEHFDEQQEILFANLLAQSKAFIDGKSPERVKKELLAKHISKEIIEDLKIHKSLPGNKPHNVILLDQLTPRNLGMIMAMYEHKIYVQGVIWDINSFDQFGVELGKELADELLPFLQDGIEDNKMDGSTIGLINYYKDHKIKSTV